MDMKKFTVGILTAGLVFVAGCSKDFKLGANKVLFNVNDTQITQQMYDKMFERGIRNAFMGQNKLDLKDPKNRYMYLAYKNNAVNMIIMKELLIQEAKKKNITVTDEEINNVINNISERVGGKDKLNAKLAENKVPMDEFVDNIRMDIMTKKLVDKITVGQDVSDAEVKKFYDENRTTRFKNPEMVRAKHILISASESDIKTKIESETPNITEDQKNKKIQEEINKAKAKAEKILAEVKANPTNFDALAKKYSEDPSSAQKGGDLGFFPKDQMVKEFSQVAFSLKPGLISDLVKTQFGYHIIKVTDRKKDGIVPFNEVSGQIKQFLTEQKKMMAFQQLTQTIKNQAVITYVDPQYDPEKIQDELKKLAATTQGQPTNPPAAEPKKEKK